MPAMSNWARNAINKARSPSEILNKNSDNVECVSLVELSASKFEFAVDGQQPRRIIQKNPISYPSGTTAAVRRHDARRTNM